MLTRDEYLRALVDRLNAAEGPCAPPDGPNGPPFRSRLERDGWSGLRLDWFRREGSRLASVTVYPAKGRIVVAAAACTTDDPERLADYLGLIAQVAIYRENLARFVRSLEWSDEPEMEVVLGPAAAKGGGA